MVAAKIYVGGVRPDEDWTVRVNTGEYSAILGDSFENVARQRPQLPAFAEWRPLYTGDVVRIRSISSWRPSAAA